MSKSKIKTLTSSLLGITTLISIVTLSKPILAATITGSTGEPIISMWNINKETNTGTIAFGPGGSGQIQQLQNIIIDNTNWKLLSFVTPASGPDDPFGNVIWQFQGNNVGDSINLIPEKDGPLGTLTVQTFQVKHTPEPTSTLSLLALGTLGAVSTLKRKLKPSQSLEKETTKVG